MNASHVATPRWHLTVPAIVLTTIFISTVSFPQEPVNLTLGKTLDRALAAGEKHQYRLQLPANTFIFAVADQKGVDLVIRLISPGGKMIREFDGPTRAWGPEFIVATADSAGTYHLEVAPVFAGTSGHYTIVLKLLEPVATDPAKRVDQLMSPWSGKTTPGASIGVVKDGKLVFAKGYGLADLETGLPNTPQTIFHMASVSKQFTAMAILMLADQGKLALDDSIQQYLPEMPSFGKTITIRQLLHHTSGLRDQWDLWVLAGGRMDDVITQDDLYRLVTRQRELNFAPGSEYLYSNTGFMLLAKIVERVTGSTFRSWMQQHVFNLLGMTHTQIYDDHQRIVLGRAYSFLADSGGFHKTVLNYANSGATSLFSTVDDLALWLGNFWNPRVGGDNVLRMLLQRGVLTSGDTIPYACGISVYRMRGQQLLAHGGSDAGYQTQLMCLPGIRGGVIVLSNLASFNPRQMADELINLYFADRLEKEKPPAASPIKTPPEIALSPSVFSVYEGRFYMQETPNAILNFTTDGGRFYGQVAGQQRYELHASTDTTFFVKEVPVSVTFHRQGDKTVELVTIHSNGDHDASRTKPPEQAEVSLLEYAGLYYSPELETVYTLVVKNGKLFASNRRVVDAELTLGQKDAFSTSMGVSGHFERGATGKVTGLRISAERVRNLLFEKIEEGTVQASKP